MTAILRAAQFPEFSACPPACAQRKNPASKADVGCSTTRQTTDPAPVAGLPESVAGRGKPVPRHRDIYQENTRMSDTPVNPTTTDTSGTVDAGNMDDLKARANALYAQVQELALGFEEDTAGAKTAKDKAKSVSA